MFAWTAATRLTIKPTMSVGGFSASVTTCMDWAINEFSVSGTPALSLFDSNLTMSMDTPTTLVTAGTNSITAATNKSSISTVSNTQRVVDNTAATTETAAYDSFIAAAPDQFNYSAWATITKKGSFNFGTIKKMEPIMMKLDAIGVGWLVVYSAPEQYG